MLNEIIGSLTTRLGEEKGNREHREPAEQAEDLRGIPSVVLAAELEREHEADDRADERNRADPVDPLLGVLDAIPCRRKRS